MVGEGGCSGAKDIVWKHIIQLGTFGNHNGNAIENDTLKTTLPFARPLHD